MERLLNPLLVQEKLIKNKLNLFTLIEFRRLFNTTETAAKKFTERYVKKGFFVRLKKSIFIIKTIPPSSYLIANKLYESSYVSFDAALSFYGIISETIYAITSATPKATREFKANNSLFTYQKIKREAYTGYRLIKYLGETIFMAEPEKALADYLYFIDLGKRKLEYERLDLSKIKKAKLLNYVKLFKRPQMQNLVKQIYADFRKPKRVY